MTRLVSVALCALAAPAMMGTLGKGKEVTVDNFYRAETDMYFERFVGLGAMGKLAHIREPPPVDKQPIVRMNRDTLYSFVLLDLRHAPATLTFPETGRRFVSMLPLSEDHDSYPTFYSPGKYTLRREDFTTDYVAIVFRTFMSYNNQSDIEAAHAIQDGFRLEQSGGPGKFEAPAWNQTDQDRVRTALKVLGATTTTPPSEMCGMRADLDRLSHLFGVAMGWGCNRATEATYVTTTPKLNDGSTTYSLTVHDVPLEGNGFWSVTVYDAAGFMFAEPASVNDHTAVRSPDGTYTITFGGCEDSKRVNCMPIKKGWNYLVRLYRPSKAILDGTWKFPEAQPDATEAAATAEAVSMLV